jgi:protein-disulfide isomerase
MAAECAGEQGNELFWSMSEAIFQTQMAWQRESNVEAMLYRIASEVSNRASSDRAQGPAGQLDLRRYLRCLRTDARQQRIEAGAGSAKAADVRATPTFVINGERIVGAISPGRFREIVDRLLSQDVDG